MREGWMEGGRIEGGRDAKHPDIELVSLTTYQNTQSSTHTFQSHTHKATPTCHPPDIFHQELFKHDEPQLLVKDEVHLLSEGLETGP